MNDEITESKFVFPKVIDIVINATYGGYGYSDEALEELQRRRKLRKQNDDNYDDGCDNYRRDVVDIELIKEWGSERVSSHHSYMKVYKAVENNYSISEYDGLEEIHSYFHRERYFNESTIIEILKRSDMSADKKVNMVLQMSKDLDIFKSKVEELCEQVNEHNHKIDRHLIEY